MQTSQIFQSQFARRAKFSSRHAGQGLVMLGLNRAFDGSKGLSTLILFLSLLLCAAGSAMAQSPPVAANDLFFTTEGFAVPLTVLANDYDPDDDLDTASLSIVIPPNNGTLVINYVTGILTYTPFPYFNGVDEFRYRISDQTGLSNTAFVTLLVYPVNDPPLVQRDVDSTLEGTAKYIRVLLNDSDPLDPLGNINPFSLSMASAPIHGSAVAVPGPLGRVFYTPPPGFTGVDSFEYRVCDDGHPLPALCGTAWVLVHVRGRVIAGPDRQVCPGDSVRLTAAGPGPYTWSPAEGLSCTECNAPWASPDSTTVYTVSSTAGGCCPNSDEVTVTVYLPGIVQAITDSVTLLEDGSASVQVLLNDVLVDDSEHFPVGGAQNGSASLHASGLMSYTPNANFWGLDSAAYAVCPPACPSSCDTGWVFFVVNPVNDPPIILPDSAFTLEDESVNIAVLANDSDPDAGLDPASVMVTTPPLNGSVVVNPDGSITFTPDPDYSGEDAFYYEVCDTGFPLPPECGGAWVYVVIWEVNDPIQAVNDTVNTLEDTPLSVLVLSNDWDPENQIDSGSLSIVMPPANGSVLLGGAGSLLYSPSANYYGWDSLQYQICDAQVPVTCDMAWVFIRVEAVNDAPLAQNDVAITDEDIPVLVDVLANDSDIDGNLVLSSLSLLTPPLNGTVALDPSGAVLYTPALNFFGTDSLEYQICDDGYPLPSECSSAWLIILVLPVNDPVLAEDDFFDLFEDTPSWLDVLANDTDVDGMPDPASVEILTAAAHGSLSTDPMTGQVLYSPDLNYYGPDSFQYRVCDDGMPPGCSNAWVYLNVLPVNDAPIALNDSISGLQDTPISFEPLLNDSDVDGNIDPSTFSLLISPLNGLITIDALSGMATWIPNPGFFGTDSALYQVCDDGYPLPAECASAWILIQVIEVPPLPNVAPIARRDTASVAEDGVLVLDVLANDEDPDGFLVPATLSIWQMPLRAHVSADGFSGLLTFTPDADVYGLDSFAYRICDNGPLVLCDSAWVLIDVWPLNDAPFALNDTASTLKNTPLSVDVLANDFDIDGNLLPSSLSIISAALNGSALIDASGLVLYSPALDFFGMDSLEYQICDDGYPLPSECSSAWLFIDVLPVNEPMTAVDDFFELLEDVPTWLDVLANDFDSDGVIDPGTLEVLIPAAHGLLSVDASGGQVLYSPNLNYFGADSFRYRVCDDGVPISCSAAVVRLNVLPVNDAPVALNDYATTFMDSLVLIPILLNDSDVDGALVPSSVSQLRAFENGTALWDVTTALLNYQPDPGFLGLDSLMYRVCDDGYPLPSACDSAWVLVEVISLPPPNTAPIAMADYSMGELNQEQEIQVLLNDFDAEGNIDPGVTLLLEMPLFGSLSGSDGEYFYQPALDFCGLDSFRYRVCDSLGLCDEAPVYLLVHCPDSTQPFFATDDVFSLPADLDFSFNVLDNDHPDAQAYCLEIISLPLNGEVVVESNGVLTYRPKAYFGGRDSLRYQVCGPGFGQLATASVRLTIFHSELQVAQGFSPNGDGRNDAFRILGLDLYPSHSLLVVNRWGDEVFRAAPYRNDWDGDYRGKPLPEGTYFYWLTLDPDDPRAVLSGAITLRR